MSNGNKIFTVLVVGDNPEQLMEKYKIGIKVERYCKYRYLDAEKLLRNNINVLNEIVNKKDEFNFSAFQVDFLKDKIKALSKLTPFEYYTTITKGLYYDDNGDAWSDDNPNGKWEVCNVGKNFSIPFKMLNGSEAYQAYKKDIAWNEMHMSNTNTYETVWELVVEKKKPSNDVEETLFNNMKDKENYFASFSSKKEYVLHNCAYWNYAFLDENGWVDMDDDGNQAKWIQNYYERFIKNLNDDATLTIFECTKPQGE